LLLVVACAQPAVQPAAQPVVEEKVVEKVVVQCWDGSTAASLEDCPAKQEEKIVAKEIVAPVKEASGTLAQKLLAQARSYSAHSYELEDRIVLVSNNKARHLFKKVIFVDRKPVTDVYVNLGDQTAIAYCDLEHEAQILGNAFTWDKSECKHFIDNSTALPFGNWVMTGPLDYLADFADATPSLIENSSQMITILGAPKNVQPSLHYDAQGKSVILRIDQRKQVPIQIEIGGQLPIGFKEVFFDVIPLYGKQENIADLLDYTPVSQDWVKTIQS